MASAGPSRPKQLSPESDYFLSSLTPIDLSEFLLWYYDHDTIFTPYSGRVLTVAAPIILLGIEL